MNDSKSEHRKPSPTYDARATGSLRVCMSPNRRGVPAKKVARDFGSSLASFVEEVISLVAKLDGEGATASAADRCFETCAALWATIVISVNASALHADEREALGPLIFQVLDPIWAKHCGTQKAAFGRLRSRAEFYLALNDPRSHINTATIIVTSLVAALGISGHINRRSTKRLSALLAHRMLGDIHRLNDLKMQFGIQISFVALILSGYITLAGETLLRVLRLA